MLHVAAQSIHSTYGNIGTDCVATCILGRGSRIVDHGSWIEWIKDLGRGKIKIKIIFGDDEVTK